METQLLLPNRFKLIGWIILIPATILGVIILSIDTEALAINTFTFALFNQELMKDMESFVLIETNITPTLAGILFIVGAILVGFSKEKREDEFIASVRLKSLLWAVMINYVLLFVAFIFVYGYSFMHVMYYNMFTVLIIFIARFHYILYLNSKRA